MKETVQEYLESLDKDELILKCQEVMDRNNELALLVHANEKTREVYTRDMLEQSNYVSQIICDAMSQGGVVKIVHGTHWVKEDLVEIHVPSYDYRQERNYMSNKQMRGYAATRGAAELMCERFDWEIVPEEE